MDEAKTRSGAVTLPSNPSEIAFLAQNSLFIRSWVDGGLLAEVAKREFCVVLADHGFIGELLATGIEEIPGVRVQLFKPGRFNLYLSQWSNRLNWVLQRRKSSSFQFWLERHFLGNQLWFTKNMESFAQVGFVFHNLGHLLRKVVSQPLVVIAFFTPLSKAVLALTKFLLSRNVRPGIIPNVKAVYLTGVGTDNSNAIAVLAARKANIPSFQLMDNWDNLTSKASYVFRSDFITVMGPRDVAHAVQIHGYQPNEVFPIGLPKFEVWRSVAHHSAAPSCKGELRVLYAGFSLPHCEVRLVNYLMEAIAMGKLEGETFEKIELYYRPHPARLRSELDSERVAEGVIKLLGHFEGKIHSLPRLGERYVSDLAGFDLVICPPTTLLWECAFLGIPTLVDLTSDGVYRTSAGNSSRRYLHIRELVSSGLPQVVETPDQLVEAVIGHIRGQIKVRPLQFEEFVSIEPSTTYVEDLLALP